LRPRFKSMFRFEEGWGLEFGCRLEKLCTWLKSSELRIFWEVTRIIPFGNGVYDLLEMRRRF